MREILTSSFFSLVSFVFQRSQFTQFIPSPLVTWWKSLTVWRCMHNNEGERFRGKRCSAWPVFATSRRLLSRLESQVDLGVSFVMSWKACISESQTEITHFLERKHISPCLAAISKTTTRKKSYHTKAKQTTTHLSDSRFDYQSSERLSKACFDIINIIETGRYGNVTRWEEKSKKRARWQSMTEKKGNHRDHRVHRQCSVNLSRCLPYLSSMNA